MKASVKEQYNDVLRHLVNSGAYIFRACNPQSVECKEKYDKWLEALEKAERMIEEIADG